MWKFQSNSLPHADTAFIIKHKCFPSVFPSKDWSKKGQERSIIYSPTPSFSTNIWLAGSNFKYLSCVVFGQDLPFLIFDTPGSMILMFKKVWVMLE